ncbi:MAG: 7-cyano-7-deazaguanine synthase [Planctomycetota bacterium]
MAKRLSVVLASGGIDSTVAAALAAQHGPLALLHLEYGQQAAGAERQAFEAVCEWLEPMHQQVVSLGDWAGVADSPLLRPDGRLNDATTAGSSLLADSFVPMLSAAMLCRAAAWAYTLGAGRVLWGASLDNPSNDPGNADAARLIAWQVIQRSLPGETAPVLEAPLAQYTKAAVAALAADLDVPLEVTWSCLRAGPEPCRRCIGCVARAKALAATSAR